MSESGFTVTVPASTANLGPGFDSLGMALALHDVLEVWVTENGLTVEVVDAGAGEVDGVPTDETHLIVRALRSACAHLGVRPPGLHLRCYNAIPHARGLGSSAAAIVAGVAAGYRIAGRVPDADALRIAADFEGHADNVAASLLGGLVIAWREDETAPGQQTGWCWRAERMSTHGAIRPVVAIPAECSSTDATRGLLPVQVPHTDAAFTVGRAALAVHALTTRPDLLFAATADRLHQAYRTPALPASMRLVRELRACGVAAAISGAGPCVLALTLDGVLPEHVEVAGFVIRELAVAADGVRITYPGS